MTGQFDAAIRHALADILDRAPKAPDSPHDLALVASDGRSRRPSLVLFAAATIVTVGIGGIVIVQSRGGDPGASSQPGPVGTAAAVDPEPTVPSPAPPTTEATIPTPVRGNPTCGAELPVEVEVPSAPDGPANGSAVSGPAAEGQFAQHWALPAGTIEVRWPADPREVYDLDRVRGDRSVFDALSVSVPTGGRQLHVKAQRIDPDTDANTDTMTLIAPAAIGTAGWTSPDCSIIQVRYIDHDGNQLTMGYDLTAFDAEPGFGIDLNPVIVATETVATAPTDIATCGTPIGADVTSTVAPTPADALVAYLEGDAPAGLMRSGYRELHVDDGTIVYTWSNSQALVTAIKVEPSDNGWSVTRLDSAGC